MSDTGILDQVTSEFMQALRQDGSAIQAAAHHLFYYLCVIQLSFTALWMVLSGESLHHLMVRLVQLTFTFGFFYGLIELGGTWIPDLLNGFIQVGQSGGVQSLDPSSIIDQGVSIAGGIFNGFFNWGLLGHPFVSLIGAAICVTILIIYAFIAAELTVILVKAYAVISIGGFFFALGATEYTRAMTQKFVSAAIGLGLQLMMLYLLLGVGQNVGSQWAQMTKQASDNHEIMPMLVIMAAAIVYYLIIKNVPTFIAGLSGVGGFRNYGDTAAAMAMNTGINTASALSQAKNVSLTGARIAGQVGTSAGNLSAGFQSRESLGSFAKQGLSNAGHAAFQSVRDYVKSNNTHMNAFQKFNHHLSNRVKEQGNGHD